MEYKEFYKRAVLAAMTRGHTVEDAIHEAQTAADNLACMGMFKEPEPETIKHGTYDVKNNLLTFDPPISINDLSDIPIIYSPPPPNSEVTEEHKTYCDSSQLLFSFMAEPNPNIHKSDT